MPWVGGKSAAYAGGTGRWVNSLLPPESIKRCYVEPFAGMLGVLLQRLPLCQELVSDTNRRIINWWTQLRDNHEQLIYKIEHTPYSREQYFMCREMMDDPDPLTAAWAFTIVIAQCFTATDMGSPTWITPSVVPSSPKNPTNITKRIPLLKERVKKVAFENRPADAILERYVDSADVLIYCDPPYPSSPTNMYTHPDLDSQKISELLSAQKGFVAISGIGQEWDHLGWQKHEHQVTRGIRVRAGNKEDSLETEILWTNYRTEDYPARAEQQSLII